MQMKQPPRYLEMIGSRVDGQAVTYSFNIVNLTEWLVISGPAK
jgi:hypothetical protein